MKSSSCYTLNLFNAVAIFLLFITWLHTTNCSAIPQVGTRYGNADEWGRYFQGDIKLTPDQRNGILLESKRWKNGVVPYHFSEDFDNGYKPTVLKAMKTISDSTGGCIKYVERTKERDYLELLNSNEDNGCWSFVGRKGRQQEVNLPDWCLNQFGSVMHELVHALGFFHEQSRPDRDDYIKVVFDNIEKDYWGNFEKYSENFVGTFGQKYDYLSLMHYGPWAFSKNGQRTIITKDQKFKNEIGQREKLSETDLAKIKKMYNC